MKTIFLSVLLCLLTVNVFAQDIIYKKDGTKDSVIVKEVNPDEVVYTKYKRPDGPIYRILKSNLLLIEFEDGTIEVFTGDNVPEITKSVDNVSENSKYAQYLGRNIISLNYLNILNGNIHLGYERITKNGVAGIKLSVNFNVVDDDAEILAYNRDFTTGLDLNLYPTGQGKIKYFIGPAFRVGVVSNDYDYTNPFFTRRNIKYNYLGVFFNNGFNVQATPNLTVGFQGALGIGRFSRQDGVATYTEVDGILAFNMGYRF